MSGFAFQADDLQRRGSVLGDNRTLLLAGEKAKCDAHPLRFAWVATQLFCPRVKGVRDSPQNDDKQNERHIRKERTKPGLYESMKLTDVRGAAFSVEKFLVMFCIK